MNMMHDPDKYSATRLGKQFSVICDTCLHD